jgi:anthranilate phosphoribosyltransferase
VTPVRRALGFRTAFNFLGPICNPASVPYQVLGVSAADRAPLLAQALARLGTRRAMVVHGEDGLDELTLTGESTVWELEDGVVRSYTVAPEQVGVARVPFEAIAGGGCALNVALATALLRGEADAARTAHTALNAAAGLIVTGQCVDWSSAYDRAHEVLRSGAAWTCFERYRDATCAERDR